MTASRHRLGGASSALDWLVMLAVAALTVIAIFFSRRPDPGAAVAAAGAELQRALLPGETLRHQAIVRRRHWWNYWRATYGVLAATDRRLLFVGIAPPPFQPRIDPLPEIEMRSLPYDSAFTVRPARLFLGREAGLRLESGGTVDEFAADGGQSRQLQRVAELAARTVAAYVDAARREQAWRDSLSALPPLRTVHRVRRGDALSSIAATYGTTADEIRKLNGMSGERVRAGQQLIVRLQPRPIPPCPAERCAPRVP